MINQSLTLNKEAQDALWDFLQFEFWPDLKVQDHNVEVVIDDTSAFRRTLILKNVTAIPQDKEGYLFDDSGFVLKQNENRYCIYGNLKEPVDETFSPFTLGFENAEVQVESFNCIDSLTFWDNPWDYLQTVASLICKKADLSHDYCNSLELNLLPLLKEISILNSWIYLAGRDNISFPHLKHMLVQHNYYKALSLFEQLEKQSPKSRHCRRILQKIISSLCEIRYEPLWREVFEKIKLSQNEYPNKAELLTDPKLLYETRADIQTLMETHGYAGTYPDFIKIDSMPGIHLAESYGMTYFVGMEKRVVYHIHCFESLEEPDYFSVQFLCGTALLRKDESVSDIYSCLFNAKGKRLYHLMHYYVPLDEANIEIEPDNLLQSVNIAVKKTELRTLTKEERKEYYGTSLMGWGGFLLFFLLGGGLFSILLNLGMMLIIIIIFFLLNETSAILDMFTEIPWVCSIAFAWIAYGGVMGLLTFLAKRK